MYSLHALGRHARFLRTVWVALAIAVALLVTAPTLALAVEEIGHSHIRGTVTSDGVTPAYWASVTAWRSTGGGWLPSFSSWVMKDGTYDISCLVAGTYRLKFDPYFTDSHLVSKWYSEKSSLTGAADVVVGPSSIVDGVDANLVAGHISGRAITGGGMGIPGVTVSAYESDGCGGWAKVGEAVTGSEGSYDVGSLRTGAHRLMFETSADYLGIAFGGGDSVWSAEAVDIPVTVGMNNSGNTIILSPAGHVSGKVTNDGTTGVKNVSVYLYRQDGASLYYLGARTTAVDGTYDFGGLASGVYHAQFHDGAGRHPDEWYSDQTVLESATDITVNAGSTSTANATLSFARIRGTVTALGQPLEGIEVRVYRMSGESVMWQCLDNRTAADGTYDIGGLPALSAGETFHVVFLGGAGAYGNEYYLNDSTLAEANDIAVAAGETVEGIDAFLEAGSLQGTVTAGASGLEGITVYAVHPDSHISVAWATTDPEGRYSFPVLPPGPYHLRFEDYNCRFRGEYSGDTTEVALASSVTVLNGYTSTFEKVMQEYGHITGRVTSDGSTGLGGVTVAAQTPHPGGGFVTRQDETDSDGYYDIYGLEPATYRLHFMPPNTSPFGQEWYSDASDWESATPIAVSMGSIASGKDATLSEIGHVAGAVTDGVSGIPGVLVSAYFPDGAGGWTYATGAFTRADGTYLINNLPEGEYRFGFDDPDEVFYYNGGVFLDEYYPNAPDVGSATTVPISAGTTTAIDAVMARESRLSGVVRNSSGQPLGGITVGLYVAHSFEPGRYDTTASDGSYDFGLVPAANYLVSFSDQSRVYFNEYFDDFQSGSGSTEIPVAAGDRISGIDATLTAGAHITGRVTSDGLSPMNEVIVYAYRFDQYSKWSPAGVSAVTGADGTYDLSPLRPGAYRLMFYDINQVRATEWYDDAFGSGTGASVNVTDGATTPGIDAVLGPAGSIEGTVTAQGAGALSGGWVYASVPNGSGGWDNVAEAATGANGAYRLTGLRPGEYRIEFCKKSPYLGEYYDDVSSISLAATVTVVAEQVTSGISAELNLPSSITGRVTYEGTLGIPGTCVRAETSNGSGGWTLAGYAYTNAEGYYVIAQVNPGIYRVSFDGDSQTVGEYYNDTYDSNVAAPVTVLRGYDTTGIDAVLAARGHISGQVLSYTGAPVPYATVSAYSKNEYGNWAYVTEATANSAGCYDVGGLLPAAYRVSFADPGGQLTTEFYDDQTSLASANEITVTAGSAISGVNATLTAPSSIAGTVTAAGSGLEGSLVKAWRSDGSGGWQQATSTYSDASGAYALGQLSPGSYLVEFGGVGSRLGEWFDDAPEYSEATTVTLAGGQSVAGVSGDLDLPGGMTGAVTSGSGTGIAQVTVLAYRQNASGGWNQVASATSTESGGYEFSGLRPGSYRAYFIGPTGFGSEYYNDQEQWDLATAVPITGGEVIGGINAVLTSMGSISGTVTSDGANGIGSVNVAAYTFSGDGWTYSGSAQTTASGTYTITDLWPGTYRVSFSATSDYLGEFFNDAASVSAGQDVTVQSGYDTPGIDAVLSPAGHVTGTVTDAVSGLASMRVVAWRMDEEGFWGQESSADTAPDGSYDIGGLRSGQYRIQFEGDATHAGEYYSNQPSSSSADTITVTPGGTTPGINAELAPPAHIMGTVRSTEDTGIPDVTVHVYAMTPSGAQEWRASAVTGADGAYDVGGLPGGTYYIFFQDYSGTYVSEAHLNAENVTSGTPIVVAWGGTQAGIDAILEKAGSIAGAVRSESSQPISGAWVSLYKQKTASQWVWCDSAVSGADGTYLMYGLSPGTYRVEFSHASYMSEYYSDAVDVQTAANVTVTPGGYTGAIDATLSVGGTISGTVTSDGGGGVQGLSVYAYRSTPAGMAYANYGMTDVDGKYLVTGLRAGDYRIWFCSNDDTNTSEWFDNVQRSQDSTPVVLAKDENRSGVDAVLARKGYVRGRVTTDGVNGASGIRVELFEKDAAGDWTSVADCYTDSAGGYRTPGVAAGAARVMFVDESGVYASEYYDDKALLADSADVTITAGAETTGIDAVLGIAGHITGTVHSGGGLGLPGILVMTTEVDGKGDFAFGNVAVTDANGAYDVGGLSSGTYRIVFYDGNDPSAYGFQFFDAATAFTGATGVGVTAGSSTSGIDATLTAAGHIAGRITAGGVGHANTWVRAFAPNGQGGWAQIAATGSNADGSYDLGGLAAGAYRLQFDDMNGVEADCYLGGVKSLASSQDVTVAAGATTANVNADYRTPPPNGTPVATPDEFTASEDVTLSVDASSGVLVNDSDPDSDPLESILTSAPIHGVLNMSADGSFTYRADSNYYGPDEFAYRASDGTTQSSPVTVTVAVLPVNDAPVGAVDSAGVSENETVSTQAGFLLQNDYDVEADSLTATLTAQASHGIATVHADGSFTYRPDADYDGEDWFKYCAFDGQDYSSPTTVTITVANAPLIPTAVIRTSALAATVGIGGSYSFTGAMVASGSPVPSRQVILESSPDGSTFTAIGSGMTGATGAFAFAVNPASRSWYRVRFAGDTKYEASSSDAACTSVIAWVSTPVAPSTMYRTRYYTVYGFLKPRHTAGSGYPVRIYKYRYLSGRWVYAGYVSARAANYSSFSKYYVSVRLPYAGKWRLRAYAPADTGHVASWSSGYDYVTVR